MLDDYFFAWEGADHPDGPWAHLRVLEMRGREELSRPYWFELELVRFDGAADVNVEDLVGSRAALRIRTDTRPEFRIVHGVVAEAEELGEMDKGTRYRVTLAPPFWRATMMRKSIVYLEKTLTEIIDAVLTRRSWGAGLELSTTEDLQADDGDMSTYATPKATYAWRVLDQSRVGEREARPYCVQYEESDFAFVSRLLEEEGIAFHFEHTPDECILVLADMDMGRHLVAREDPLGPGILGREVQAFRVGGRMRPGSASLSDYNWRKPNLALTAVSKAGITEFQTHEHPGRYDHSLATGEALATVRQGRLDSERVFATGESRCRLLGAGSVFTLEHPTSKFSGSYLVTSVEHQGYQRGSFGREAGEKPPYTAKIECIRCSGEHGNVESGFRPARSTPRPRIVGSQTAIVTADPSASEAEINVGGPENIGCVRVRFHWDLDSGRHEVEPTSCWVRVSQTFAGANHGAAWHPRVGHEVIVDFLDGDPDRPIITGRVYNGLNLPHENASQKPTFSAIKSLSSPYDGNYNMIAFEDSTGGEQIIVHAARDYETNVKRNAGRAVGLDDKTSVEGDQNVHVKGNQSTTVDVNLSMHAGAKLSATSPIVDIGSGVNVNLAAAFIDVAGGTKVGIGAPAVEIYGAASITAGAPTTHVAGHNLLHASGNFIEVAGGAKIRAGAGLIEVNGGTVIVTGTSITIKGGTVAIEGAGEVNIKGGTINLNS